MNRFTILLLAMVNCAGSAAGCLISQWPVRTLMFVTAFCVALELSLCYPIIGVANYLMIYQVSPGSLWWGMPVQDAGIRLSLWAAVAMVLGMIGTWFTRRNPRCGPAFLAWELLACVMVLLAVIGYIVHGATAGTQTVILEKLCKMMFFVICFTHLVTTRKRLTVVMWVLVLGSLHLGYQAYTTSPREFVTGRLTSVGGPDFRDSSGFGAHMAAMLPLIGATFFLAPSWLARVVPMLTGVLTVNAIVLCRTRSAFVAMIVGGGTALAMAPRSWRRKVYLALLVAGTGAFSLTNDAFIERMESLSSPRAREGDTAVIQRYAIWDAGLRMVSAHPIGGVGVGSFQHRVRDYNENLGRRAAHNTLLLCAAELGIPGLVLFLTLIGIALFQLVWAYRRADQSDDPPATRLWAYAMLLSLVIYLVAAQFTDRLYTESFWLILALPTCLQRVVLGELPAREAWPLPDEPVTGLAPQQIRRPLLDDYPSNAVPHVPA
jgi:O-antigen ligase